MQLVKNVLIIQSVIKYVNWNMKNKLIKLIVQDSSFRIYKICYKKLLRIIKPSLNSQL